MSITVYTLPVEIKVNDNDYGTYEVLVRRIAQRIANKNGVVDFEEVLHIRDQGFNLFLAQYTYYEEDQIFRLEGTPREYWNLFLIYCNVLISVGKCDVNFFRNSFRILNK